MSKFDTLAPRQKALLTKDSIREFYLKEVLMERGVNPVIPAPVLEDMPPCPVIADREYYVVTMKHGSYDSTSVIFTSKEGVDALRAAKPLGMRWTGRGHDVQPVAEFDVAVRMLPNHEEAQHHREVLKAREGISERNGRACAEFDARMAEVDKILDSLWTQVVDAQFEKHLATQVNNTAEEYIRLCDGDTEKARVFLLKVFTEEEIERAEAWFKQPDKLAQ